MEKRTLVLGASLNPSRFAHKAVISLKSNNFPVVASGLREGEILGVHVDKPFTEYEEIHTVTIYLGPANLPLYYDYILKLKPKRVIFNPGTEDAGFAAQLLKNGIRVVEDCTLVMINSGQF